MYIARLCEGRVVKYGTQNLLWRVYIVWMIHYLTNKYFMTASSHYRHAMTTYENRR